MQNLIPATIPTGYGSSKTLSYSEVSLRRVWRYSNARQRHIDLLMHDGATLEGAARQAETNFDGWVPSLGDRGVTPEIDIEVFERYCDENMFRNIGTAKKESEYEFTMKEPGGVLVRKGQDGNFLLQTLEPGSNPFASSGTQRSSTTGQPGNEATSEQVEALFWRQFADKTDSGLLPTFLDELLEKLKRAGVSKDVAHVTVTSFAEWVMERNNLTDL